MRAESCFQNYPKKGGEKEIRQQRSRSRKGKKTYGISTYRMEVKE
jgi:hypothetical protein